MGAWRTRSKRRPDGALAVAQYVRMSTDHQRYSTENQRDAIQQYAVQHGMAIVRTYADEGKSGLNLEHREGLKQLIRDVESGETDFEAILVYDISRWGRFQDADESAYYEYVCRRAGIRIHYCAEPFENDGSPMTVVIKSVKRVMAAEYSRELSTKVFMGQCRLIELGFRQGGPAGFGLRRMLMDEGGSSKGELRMGERKSLQTDRVILTPGPAQETAIVRQIYEQFAVQRRSEREIADELNAAGIATDRDRKWTRGTVHQLLINEKYIGNNVYNRVSFKLKEKRVRNPPEMWVRSNGVFEPVVPLDLFSRANALIAARSEHLDDESMLERLRKLLNRTGSLSGLLIDEQDDMPSSSAYRQRFGGLVRAYSLIGFEPERDFAYVEINRNLRARRPDLIAEISNGLIQAGGSVDQNPTSDLLTVNGEFTISIVLARCQRTPGNAYRWHIRFDTSRHPDITVAIRLAEDQETILDYYLFPRIDIPPRRVRLAEENNGFILDAYRFESLDALYGLAERVPFQLAA